ncbi:hypothetical protein FNF27_00369 [Cafeteria roenbergensis]|uniref:C2H2-type domain-containing protein n=2 Tax=Cafeteria roenbergensis TaxID=33653 RepID=A0A5A8ERW2_CAFRO|nr:hypothetical protein FNF31_04863 [Cafeteria roenbergensis]KAA0178521.1 hypothetical protein FNF27_00369 [Cafeteria roenbergensis]
MQAGAAAGGHPYQYAWHPHPGWPYMSHPVVYADSGDSQAPQRRPSQGEESPSPATPPTCEQCGRTFSRPAHLRRHVMAVHERRRPYQCDQCGASFAASSDRNAHVSQVHQRVRPFVCPQCDTDFARRSHLRSHLAKVHGEALSPLGSRKHGCGPPGGQDPAPDDDGASSSG